MYGSNSMVLILGINNRFFNLTFYPIPTPHFITTFRAHCDTNSYGQRVYDITLLFIANFDILRYILA